MEHGMKTMYIVTKTVFVVVHWIVGNKLGTVCTHLAQTWINYIQVCSGRL